MLKRVFLSLALMIMFAFAQTGAVLHEVSHYSDSTPSKQQDKVPHSPVCEKCVSYGELAHALDAQFSALPHMLGVQILSAYQLYTHTPALSYAYAARAPPTQLA
jgi:hypothetical protein